MSMTVRVVQAKPLQKLPKGYGVSPANYKVLAGPYQVGTIEYLHNASQGGGGWWFLPCIADQQCAGISRYVFRFRRDRMLDVRREAVELLEKALMLPTLYVGDPRVVVLRGPYRKGRYCLRRDIYINGDRLLGSFMESDDFDRLDQQDKFCDGPWTAMVTGRGGFTVPEIDNDPYTVAIAIAVEGGLV